MRGRNFRYSAVVAASVAISTLVTAAPSIGASSTTSSRVGFAAGSAAPTRPSAVDVPVAAPSRHEVIVDFEAGAPEAAIAQAAGSRVSRRSRRSGFSVVPVPSGESVEEFAAELNDRPGVEFAEPNYIRRITATNDTHFTDLWGLENTGQTVSGPVDRSVASRTGIADADMDVVEAWLNPIGIDPVKVAVIDTGVDLEHPDLQGGIVDQTLDKDFVGNGTIGDDNADDECNGHGTHVAGTIGAQRDNLEGIAGVSNRVSIIPIRVGECGGSIDVASIVDAFAYAKDNGVRVVNASFGGPGGSLAEEKMIRSASNTLFVVAAGNAGNNNDKRMDFPCNYFVPNVLCVAATTQKDARASFSNFGAQNVDVGAPGVNIRSTYPWDTPDFEDNFNGPSAPTFDQWVESGSPANAWVPFRWGGSDWGLQEREGPYWNNMDTTFGSAAPMDLTGHSNCMMGYYLERYLAVGDKVHLEMQDDDATWDNVRTFSGNTGFEAFFRTPVPAIYEGDSAFRFRWHMETGPSVRSDGVYIDDIVFECDIAGESNYVFFDGTSMAAPHAAGVAALLWAANPTATVTSVKNAIMKTGQTSASLQGKTVTGKRINADEAMDLLATDPSPERIQTKSDGNDSASPLDIKKVTLGNRDEELGNSDDELRVNVQMFAPWSNSKLKSTRSSAGLIDVVFDTDKDLNLDYFVRIVNNGGTLMARVYKCTNARCSRASQTGFATVNRTNGSSSVEIVLTRSQVGAKGSLIFWFGYSGYQSRTKCRSACHDNAPNRGSTFQL